MEGKYVVYFDHQKTCSQFTLDSFQKLLGGMLESCDYGTYGEEGYCNAEEKAVMITNWDGKVEIAVTIVILAKNAVMMAGSL